MQMIELCTLLIVDDEPEHLEAIIEIIEEYSNTCNIFQALSGETAFEIAKKEMPDIVITDWEMPGMDGLELIKKIKNDKITRDIPVIMCTGVMTSSENLEAALQAGASDYVRKPVDKIELIARIRANLHLAGNYKKIKKLNETKDKLLSIISHDLRTPFQAILGLTELMITKFDEFDNQEKNEILNSFYDSTKQTYNLLDNLLLWTQSQKDGIVYNPESLNLNSVSRELVDLLTQSFQVKEITLLNQIHEDINVKADRYMLSTIFRNLISNAIKFTPKGGKVMLKSEKLIRENRNGFVEITVKDNGVGIPSEMHSKLFNIGENVSTKGTENETGTGLGLILCKEFVQYHKGEIRIDSKQGKGSEFKFTVPLDLS